MPDETKSSKPTFDQREQQSGAQTNIAGDVHGPVLSGQFNGPVYIGASSSQTSGSTFDLRTCIVRVESLDGKHIAGTGFVVAPDLVVTCVHVVDALGVGAGGRVRLMFHVGRAMEAEVTADGWHPEEDVAFLRLSTRLPEGAVPVELGSSNGCSGHAYFAFGYPEDGEVQAHWPQGRIGGLVPIQGYPYQLLQLQGAEVDQGLSGSPVFDNVTSRTVGMIAAIKNLDDRRIQDPKVRYAYAIPAETIHSLCKTELGLLPPESGARTYPIPFQVPPLPVHFVQRPDDISEIKTQFLAEDIPDTLVVSVIHGLGGVGKSTFAASLCRTDDVRRRFSDGVLWATFGDSPDLLALLGVWIQSLGGYFASSTIEAAKLHLQTLLENRSVLLVMDDVWQIEHVRPFLAGGKSCRALITTREKVIGKFVGAQTYELGVLTPEQAETLLCKHLGRSLNASERATASELAQTVGYLPLALQLAAVQVADGVRWEELLGDLCQEIARLETLDPVEGYEEITDEAEHKRLSVTASFDFSLRRLASEMRQCFVCLGILPANTIITASIARAIWGLPDDRIAWDNLRVMYSKGLLLSAAPIRIRQQEYPAYRVHNLMYLYIRKILSQEISPAEQGVVRKRLDRWYLVTPDLHFYVRAKALDGYIHLFTPDGDSEMAQIIIEVLQTHDGLRRYFFQRGPNPAWTAFLYEQGFFEQPPSPIVTDQGVTLPHWDVLYFLQSVANQVPEMVVKVVESIDAEGWYISQVIRALNEIPTEYAIEVVPRLVQWLEEPHIARSISTEAINLIGRLTDDGQLNAGLALLDALTAPILPTKTGTRSPVVGVLGEAEAKFSVMHDYEADRLFKSIIPQLGKLAPACVVKILQNHLCTALQIEARVMDNAMFETQSWWRTAIEDTGQDQAYAYRDRLLCTLRDLLESWVEIDSAAAVPLIQQYLQDPREILRRIGLHILRVFPAKYKLLVITELQKTENLGHVGIHHEFLSLLRTGFPLLDVESQENLIIAICNGPPPAQLNKMIEWAKETRDAEGLQQYLVGYVKNWIRERLWMLQVYLSGDVRKIFENLDEELGEPPIPPSFTRWSSGGGRIEDASPIPEQELAQMHPEELLHYISEWQPPVNRGFELQRVSLEGLASVTASVVVTKSSEYVLYLVNMTQINPKFSQAVLERIRDGKPPLEEWTFGLELCEALLRNHTVRVAYDWLEVRRNMISILELGLEHPNFNLSEELLFRIRDLLLLLLDDPDPDEEVDRSSEGYLGFQAQHTIAINAVRPRALSSLIKYAELKASLSEKTPSSFAGEERQKHIEDVVLEALTKKLDRREDSSWAVHSVFGYHLYLLFSLDREWGEQNLNSIFPVGDEEESIRYYIAAWDSYVSHHRYWHPDLEVLRSRYERAIYNLGEGRITHEMGGISPATGLAIHIAYEYLRSDYDLLLPAGPGNLLRLLYEKGTSDAHTGVTWFFWRILEDQPQKREVYWPKIRTVWEWRAMQAKTTNFADDYGDEMRQYAFLLSSIPKSETLVSLQPLLESLIPYITKSQYRTHEWDAVEQHLAEEVDRDPCGVIRLYHEMYRLKPPFDFYRATEESHKIIATAAANRTACRETLSLISLLAQQGNHEFRDVYERHKDCA